MYDTLFGYVHFRSDITFEKSGFNDLDALVFSTLSYIEWTTLCDGQGVSLLEAGKDFFRKNSEDEINDRYAFSLRIPQFLRVVMNSRRYQNVQVGYYVNEFDPDRVVQFSAVTFVLEDGTSVVTYRGTDSTILGWKEDLYMTFSQAVVSQELASKYLEQRVDSLRPKKSFFKTVYPKVYVAGHSKGGNLSLYAYEKLLKKERVCRVYNFDGPGLKGVQWSAEALSRVVTYRPEDSIIGRLFDHPESCITVQSYRESFYQHDAFEWRMATNHFLQAGSLSKRSDEIMKQLQELLLSKPEGEKEEYVDLMFSFLEALNIETIKDFSEVGFRQAVNALVNLRSMNTQQRKFLLDVANFVWTNGHTFLLTKK